MSFKIKNDSEIEVDNLFSFHNGFTGEFYIVNFYLESENEFQGIEVEITKKESFESWSIKIAKGHNLLSEEEWDLQESSVNFVNFGTSQSLSCRVYCPGGTMSDIYNPYSLKIKSS